MERAKPPVSGVGDGDSRWIDAVISALPSGVITVDATGRITHANQAAAGILGRQRQSLIGAMLADLRGELSAMLWPADKGEILLLASGRVDELEFGETRIIGFSSRILREANGLRLGTVVSFADITEDKARAREADHHRRLADLGKVVATIAHEIRNPVAAISSLAQVLGAESGIVGDPELADIVAKILDETRRIGRLVDDLLAFGRERPIERQRVDVLALVKTLVHDLDRSLAFDQASRVEVPILVAVSNELLDDSSWRLDPEAIRRILSNLVRNAWQAVVSAHGRNPPKAAITLGLHRSREFFEITVTDRGAGIPEERLPHVFEAFYSSQPNGTGLGLAIVDRLVRQHRGTISLESQPGRGTTVTLRFAP